MNSNECQISRYGVKIMRIPNKPPTNEESNKILVNKLGDDKLIDKLKPFLEIINTNYLHWDQLGVDDRFKGVDLKLLWAFVRLFRTFSIRPIKLNGTLSYIQTHVIEKTLHDLDVRIGGEINLDLEAQMPGQILQKKYLVNSLMEEAIASSQLEGAITTRIVAKKMLRENRKPRNDDEKMIVNNYNAMMFIKENTKLNQKLTLEFIKEIHKKVSKGTLEKKEYEDEFRTTNDIKVFSRDGTQIYDPPNYKNIDKLLKEVCNFINNIESNKNYFHPFVRGIIIHYMLGYIHPFNDGNGRTARALFYWYLLTQNYVYLEYIAVSTAIKKAPAQYARAYLYAETDNNDITYFVKFNLRAINIAVKSFENYINKTKIENKMIFETIQKNPKLNFRQADVIITMSKNAKPMTILEMQERYNTTYQTARTDFLNLEKLGYLKKIIRGKQFLFILDKNKCINDKK